METPTEESRVFGVLCPRGTAFGLSCASGSGTEPAVLRDFDSDYDEVYNEAPGKLLAQVREVGLTLADVTTGEVAPRARVSVRG